MINASTEFIEKLNKDGVCVNYADITLSDGTVLNLDYSDFMVSGNTVTDKTSTGKFSIGNVIAKTCSLTIANHDGRFSGYDFYKAIIYLYIGMQLDDGTVEKVRKGKYYVVEPSTKGETITIKGIDSINNFNRDYDTDLRYPATLKEIVIDACIKCGVMLPNGFDFSNSAVIAQEKPEQATYKQVLTWVAEMACGYFRMNENDFFTFVFYPDEIIVKDIFDGGDSYTRTNENTIDGGNFIDYEAEHIIDGGDFLDYTDDDGCTHYVHVKTLDVSTDDVFITGAKVIGDDKEEYLTGTEDYAIVIKGNKLIRGNEKRIADWIYARVAIYKFRPLKAQVRNDPLIEPYDVAYVHDRKGNQYFALINSVTYSTSGYTTIECNAEAPIQNSMSYYSQSASDIVQLRKDTRRKLSDYEKAVQNMNMLAANSLGVFTSEEELEDGSKIYYMHDKPNRSKSRNIYKMTQDGFFISDNYGITYSAGFDSQGNAIMNILSVIGIQFDWAKGGILSLGGLNNANGQIYIYDTLGVLCGVINNNGISIYSALNRKQIIISPLLGFVEREASSGSFEGQVADITTHFEPVYNAPNNKVITKQEVYNYQHNDILRVRALDHRYGDTFYETKWQYYYEHANEGWSETRSNVVNVSRTYSVTVQLPNDFKLKNFSVDVKRKINRERLNNLDWNRFVKEINFPSSSSYEKADGTTWDSDWTFLNEELMLFYIPKEVNEYKGTEYKVDGYKTYVADNGEFAFIIDWGDDELALGNNYTVKKDIINGTITISTTTQYYAEDLYDFHIFAMY